MSFPELLIEAIRGSEIPLRFEPGAEEAVAKPVTELLRSWLESHIPQEVNSDWAAGRRALLVTLLSELEDASGAPL